MLEAVFGQNAPFPFEVVIVDSGSTAADLALMREFPLRLLSIEPSEFGHGRTRNLLGREARGELLLYVSQDAQPASPDWLATLAAPLAEPNVAGAYARQLPAAGAHPFSRFFLARTYGAEPARRTWPAHGRLRIDEMFFSNVSSAIKREVWRRIPFREDVIMSEDQYWAYDALRAGWEVVYQPAAAVYHSHDYTLPELFRRNRASGASLRGLIADSSRGIAGRGLAYVAAEAAYLVRTGQPHRLPHMLAYEATKAVGFAVGLRASRLPSPAPSPPVSRLPPPDSRLPSPDSRPPTPVSRLPTPDPSPQPRWQRGPGG